VYLCTICVITWEYYVQCTQIDKGLEKSSEKKYVEENIYTISYISNYYKLFTSFQMDLEYSRYIDIFLQCYFMYNTKTNIFFSTKLFSNIIEIKLFYPN